MAPISVPVIDNGSMEDILTGMKKRKPILIKNWDIGPCVEKWNFEYVSNKIGNELVKIHEFYYLRSLGSDPRGKNVANFLEQYRELAEDLKIPPFYNEKDFFSSVFRVSSKGLQLWTHYDVMDNILIQVRGVKRIILWPPSEIENLYLIGDKSEVLEVDEPDVAKYPKFIHAVRYECVMNPGDVVFIPALWFHNTIAIEPSLGLNIFWKNLSHELYDKTDSYGNKDLLPAAKCIRAVETAKKSLNDLPVEYKNFYIRRIIKMLEKDLSPSENIN